MSDTEEGSRTEIPARGFRRAMDPVTQGQELRGT